MKKILYSLFVLCLTVLVGCSQNEVMQSELPMQDGKMVTVSFSATIPEFKTVKTRANGGVNDMYLLVFDQNGNFIVRQQAVLTNQTETGGTFQVDLPSSTNPRIIHFVSNYNQSGFLDNPGVNEAGIVTPLNGLNVTFWSRMELNSGISATSFSSPVVLLRNQAKISVVNSASNFTLDGFVIHNSPEKGTVAPFNSSTSQFIEGAITEPSGLILKPALQSEIGTGERFLFERRNASAANITTVIVRGIYSGQSYYYKIDLIDADKNRYDIERNYHYQVDIESVTRAGYTSFSDALAGASHNNTALDPIIEKYPMISDGTSKLEVEKTLVVLTSPGQTLQVWAKYFPSITSESFDNSQVTVALQPGNEALSGSSLAFNPSTAIITATAIGALPVEPKEARIVISKGDLARTIRVVLREPFVFDPVTINNQSPATLSGAQSQDAVLRFNIPNDFPDDLFPLPIRIYTQGLYPVATGLQMVVESGQIHYIYQASSKGTQIVNFKTNKSGNFETIKLEADYFTDGMVSYNVINRTGNLTYGSTSIPVPYAMRDNLSASAGELFMPTNNDGKYIWNLSPTQASQSQTVTFDITEGNQRKRYSRTFIPNSITNIQLNTATTLYLENGNITYGGGNGSVPVGTAVPLGTTITASTGDITITANGKFRYTLPTSYTITTPVTFTFEKQVNANYKEQYTYTVNIGNLLSSETIALGLANFVFEGSIQYLQGSWNNVPSYGAVSIPTGPGTIVMTGTGTYKYTVSGNTANNTNIVFRYSGNRNYEQQRTLDQLKSDSSLRLQR